MVGSGPALHFVDAEHESTFKNYLFCFLFFNIFIGVLIALQWLRLFLKLGQRVRT